MVKDCWIIIKKQNETDLFTVGAVTESTKLGICDEKQ